jgi:hypothetical protein
MQKVKMTAIADARLSSLSLKISKSGGMEAIAHLDMMIESRVDKMVQVRFAVSEDGAKAVRDLLEKEACLALEEAGG